MHMGLLYKLFCVLSLLSAAEVVRVPVTQIRPTQMAIGQAAVDLVEKGFVKKAANEGKVLALFIRDELEKSPLPAVRGPDGFFYITDGHHRAAAVHRLSEAGKLGGEEVRMPLRVDHDFNGQSWDEFGR